ncbi:hypothetical protein KUL156_13240 [Alteromonas sp. KUL156]|nr:hypothetical protein KUL154_31900 [Alteromonas sp. KUL154]GFD98731.1 hypothetical protein KUL156_13240 [Alteromonas sp. KUL156]
MNFKLKGIARDDAAYIAEWTFHHLYFGFDELELLVINSSDSTLTIIQKIAQVFPQVKIVLQDSLLHKPNSTFEFARTCNAGYSLQLNVDEFWVPADFKSSVRELIPHKIEPHALKLPCFQALENDAFAILRQRIYLKPVSHQLGIMFERSGCTIPAFILRRNMRSEIEYLASKHDSFSNYRVFLSEHHDGYQRSSSDTLEMEFGEAAHSKYIDAYYGFLTLTGIKPLIKRARLEVFERSQQTIQQIMRLSKLIGEDEKCVLLNLFSGIEDKSLKQALAKLDANTFRESIKTSA